MILLLCSCTKLFQSDEDAPAPGNICSNKGPAQAVPAIAAHLARLALAGDLVIEDPDLAARHYLALINADIHYHLLTGQTVDDSIIEKRDQRCADILMAFGARA